MIEQKQIEKEKIVKIIKKVSDKNIFYKK